MQKTITARYALHHAAQGLLVTGQHEASARAYGVLARLYAEGGLQCDTLREAAAAARPNTVAHREAGKKQREIYRFWADAVGKHALASGLSAAAAASRAARVHDLGAKRGVWPSALQRPVGQVAWRLSARPFWDVSDVPGAQALEASHAAILSELQSLLKASKKSKGGAKAAFTVYESDALKKGVWSDFQFYAQCRRDEANCRLCPRTAAVIAQCDEFNTTCAGAHFFSRLAAGSHIGAHCGPSNLRLRVHLGLIVPEGTRLRVGTEVRTWSEGQCLIFDDSFEHEVWHEGEGERIVLICDMWHPDIDVDSEILPTLTPDETEAFVAARNGKHLPLKKRYMTTGTVVQREP